MSGQHTPGPWWLVEDFDHIGAKPQRVYSVHGYGKTDGGYGYEFSGLARVPACEGDVKLEANARLIAAAPDLLAVLQSLMPNTLIGESYDPPVPADEVLKEFLFTWGKLRAARDAISKALGPGGAS